MNFLHFLKTWWGTSPTKHRLIVIASASVGLLLVVFVLYVTASYWLPLALCCYCAVSAICRAAKRSKQQQESLQFESMQDSRRTVAGFVQWFFCKQQRDRLGIQAIPLTASLSHLHQHIHTEPTVDGFLHIIPVGLCEFNTQSFYLLWESLVDPMNEALAEYCKIYNLYDPESNPRLKIISVDISDGAIRPEIVLKVLDLKS